MSLVFIASFNIVSDYTWYFWNLYGFLVKKCIQIKVINQSPSLPLSLSQLQQRKMQDQVRSLSDENEKLTERLAKEKIKNEIMNERFEEVRWVDVESVPYS